MKKFLLPAVLISVIILSMNNLLARSWDDLDSGEHDIYGSEKEDKFPVKTLFMEIEEWNSHYSFMFMWLFKYTDYPKYKSTRFIPFYYGLDSKIDNRSMILLPPLLTYLERDLDEYTKYIVFPLYYSSVNPSETNRSVLWPLIWWGSEKTGSYESSYHMVIPALWFHWYEIYPRDKSGEYLWLNPLFGGYSHWTGDIQDEYTWWAPIIPVLTYQSVDSSGGHRNFFTLLDYSWDTIDGRDSINRFWLLPVIMWGAGSDGYTYIVPPFYMHNKYSNGDYYRHIFPLYASWKDTENETSTQIITPLFAGRKVTDTASGNELYSNFFLPVIPLFFRSRDVHHGTHTNIAWIIDWERDREGNMRTFWFAPFVFHEFADYGYRYYFPFYMRPRCAEKDGLSFSLFHYHEWSVEKNQVITPLFARRNVIDTATGQSIYSNFFFPLIPLFFRSNDSESGTHTNIAWLLDWERDNDGKMKTFWFAPLVFHEFRDRGYRAYVPFYIRPQGCSGEEGLSYSLFHYHKWAPDNDKLWAWLYYHNNKYTGHEPGDEAAGGEKILSDYYRHILPVYWSWRNPESSGRLVLPVYLNYSDRYTKLHVNLSGVAVKTFTGPFRPDMTIGLEKKDENWFLDTDWSWFYDVISFSWRRPVFPVEGDNKAAGEIALPSEKPAIKQKSTNRDDSINYYGWDFLFGWMAYKHADTRYHWRVLPLAWFTYDEASRDQLKIVLPFYLSYYSEETGERYFMVAPFYASQNQGDSYRHGYLVNLFWSEYDSATNNREMTILWPLINWHYSPDGHGFRFIPFIWYRKWKEEDKILSRSISPLHYSMSINNNTGSYAWRRRINPLYYLHENVNETDRSYTFFAPVIPLYYYSEDTSAGENGIELKDSLSISPFHLYSESVSAESTGITASSTLMVPIIPLYYRRTGAGNSHWNLLGLIDSSTETGYSRFFVLPFFYSSDAGEVKYRNILGIIDWETGGSSGGSSMFLPFYMRHGGEEPYLALPILLSYFSSGRDWSTTFIAGTYWHTAPDYEHQDILLMYDHVMYRSGGREYNEYDFLLTLAEVDISPELLEIRAAWGFLLEYSKNRNNGLYDFDSLLWFAGIDNESGGFHHRLLPIWYYQSYSENDWFLVVPPLLSYFSEDSGNKFDLALLGLVYYRNENRYNYEDRRHVLLGILYDEVKTPERKYHSWGSLWGVLWNYEKEEETGFSKFTILKGLYKYVNKNGETEHTIFWFL